MSLSNFEEDSEEVQRVVENLDNNLHKNNLRLKGLKEGDKGDNLQSFLENVFMGCLGLETNIEVKFKFAYRIRNFRRKKNCDRDILIGFSDLTVNSLVLVAL